MMPQSSAIPIPIHEKISSPIFTSMISYVFQTIPITMAIPMSSLKDFKLTNVVSDSQISDEFVSAQAINYGCKDRKKVEDLRGKTGAT
jgi:hypothetical protein